jgi:hypothetical protein
MSQVTGPLSINNGAATPVAKSFAPIAVSPSVSIFAEKSAASSSGFVKLTTKTSPAASNRPTNRVDIDIDLPVLETVEGTNKVTRTGRFKGYFVIPDTMTADERANLHAYVANALDDELIKELIVDLETLY